ncbi:hypothetical protein [Brevibacillus sp. H7]|uniref:hypothetical protein n=1 Tax=Brevibacillus sp. H7 TaxID=3349138 RepID=UPI00380030AB
MVSFSLGDLEKIHLAIDMAQRFVRGETYHGDKPQMLLHEFDMLLEKVRDYRHDETYTMESEHNLSAAKTVDADHS